VVVVVVGCVCVCAVDAVHREIHTNDIVFLQGVGIVVLIQPNNLLKQLHRRSVDVAPTQSTEVFNDYMGVAGLVEFGCLFRLSGLIVSSRWIMQLATYIFRPTS